MRIALILVAVAALAAGFGWNALNSFNHFATVERRFDGRCAPVTGIVGPEDIKIDARARRAFISSTDRRDPSARGAIYVFDLANPLAQSAWRDRTMGAPAEFRPLGVDYYEAEGVRRLFVVNEANASVELFDVGADGDLTHLETFSERRLTSPNNVAAVGPRSFYVTNDTTPHRDTVLARAHFLARTGAGHILYQDGVAWRMAAGGLRFANGVDVSPDGERLYAAETSGMAVRVYDRDIDTGALALMREIPLAAAPDNLNADETGDVWVGALPRPLDLPRIGADREARTASEVIRLRASGFIESVYRDPGEELSASTVGARLGDMLLIGALYDRKFLICDLPEPQLPESAPTESGPPESGRPEPRGRG